MRSVILESRGGSLTGHLGRYKSAMKSDMRSPICFKAHLQKCEAHGRKVLDSYKVSIYNQSEEEI